jgi:uncharacterized protein (TIGR03435 family)
LLRSWWRAPVIDHTGLTGEFDFTLEPNAFATPGQAFPDRLRSAVEAFGFELKPLKVIVDTTVIDHVERPTEN